MFENFVYFKEVVKLSSVIEYQLKSSMCSYQLMRKVIRSEDPKIIYQLIDFVDDQRIVNEILRALHYCEIEEEEVFLNCLEKLCDRGFDILHPCSGFTLMNLVCFYGKLKLVKHMIESGVNRHTTSFIPLLSSINNEHAQIVDCLLRNGADDYLTHPAIICTLRKHPTISSYVKANF